MSTPDVSTEKLSKDEKARQLEEDEELERIEKREDIERRRRGKKQKEENEELERIEKWEEIERRRREKKQKEKDEELERPYKREERERRKMIERQNEEKEKQTKRQKELDEIENRATNARVKLSAESEAIEASSWKGTRDDKSKQDAIESATKEIGHHKELLKAKTLTPAEVINNATALTGVYITKDKAEIFTLRNQLLKVREDIKNKLDFKLPSKLLVKETKDFESRFQRDEFVQTIETSGWDAAVHGGMKIKGIIGIEAAYKYTAQEHDELRTKVNRSGTFFCRSTCSVVRVKLWEPNLHALSFSDIALDALLNIEQMITLKQEQTAQTNCELFFRKFGSHFNSSDVYFGGIYTYETRYESERSTDEQMLKKMVQSKHSLFLKTDFTVKNVSIGGEGGKHGSEAKADGTYTDTESKNVTSIVSKIGGPIEVDNFQIWRQGLKDSNSTWEVVDRGRNDINDYIGIWDIVQNQPESFRNPSKLAEILKQTWCTLTGLCVTNNSINDMRLSGDDLAKFINNSAKTLLSESEETLPNKYVDNVQALYEKVEKINRKFGETNLWVDQLNKNTMAVVILQKAATFQFTESEEQTVKHCVKALIQYGDAASHMKLCDVILWLRKPAKVEKGVLENLKTTSIYELISNVGQPYLRIIRTRKAQGPDADLNNDITVDFARTIVRLLDLLKSKNNTLEYVLLIALITPLGYDISDKCFDSQVTIDKLEKFYNDSLKVLKHYEEFEAMDYDRKQAWIFQQMVIAITKIPVSQSSKNQTFGMIIAHLKSLGKEMNNEIPFSILVSETLDLEAIARSLKYRTEGKQADKQRISWEFFANRSQENADMLRHLKEHGSDNVNVNVECTRIPKPVGDILELLGLSAYFPGKLKLQTVIAVRDDLFKNPERYTDIPWAILCNIISSNFHFRENILEIFIRSSSKMFSNESKSTDDLCLLLKDEEEDQQMEDAKQYMVKHLHPLDVFLAIFMCCDAFLKRCVAQKMSACQLAIPLIYQDFVSEKLTFSLWPIRDILIGSSDSVATQPLKTISFLRVGETHFRSKSKLINEFLRDQNEEHSTYFHKDCPLGTNGRKVANGMVEVSWFVPSPEDEYHKHCNFSPKNNPLTIFNLRGDAYSFKTQTDILLAMSTVIVLLISSKDMENDNYVDLLKEIHKHNVILVTDLTPGQQNVKGFLNLYKGKTQMVIERTKTMTTRNAETELNVSELKTTLAKHIFTLLKPSKREFILENMSKSFQDKMQSDENICPCNKGNSIASSIFADITCFKESSSRKMNILPLQGANLWQKWSTLQKDNKRVGKSNVYDPREALNEQMKRIRIKQVDKCNDADTPIIMARFIQILLTNINHEETLKFFLSWLRQYLDGESRSELPKYRLACLEAFQRYESSQSVENKKGIKTAEDRLYHASFGLEHFFREIGQVYEAFMFCSENLQYNVEENTMTVLKQLPKVVAKLLLLGFPLEIMDGDAANVPLTWIKAVFKELDEIKRNRKMVSISVLGIQSSGKSTLLNTIFGQQFPVSAGRCTRGIFAAIVPVDSESSSLPFDDVLVIDTEGLRSLESDERVHHDNEIATFVVGMGDVAIVNIKGETITDIKDVLQIVVQALLRLQQAQDNIALNQSCIIVHQNVSAEDADKQLVHGNQQLIQKLDTMTHEVASEANMEITRFNQVIAFQHMRDVKYMPDLWHGTPPMAPVSPKYAEKAVDVMQCILRDIVSTKKSFLNVSETHLRLNCLWNGILAEDFVFSFRNALEVKAYSMLDSEYQRLIWELEEFTLNWFVTNVSQKFKKCEHTNELEISASNLIEQFNSEFIEKTKEVEDSLVKFLEISELRDQMEHWKVPKTRGLQISSARLSHDIRKRICQEKQQTEVDLRSITFLLSREKEITIIATTLAKSLKGKELSDEDLQKQFDELWIKWFNEIAPKTEINVIDRDQLMSKEMKQAVYDKFNANSYLLKAEFDQKDLSLNEYIPCLQTSLDNVISSSDINTGKIAKAKNRAQRYFGWNSDLLLKAKDVINNIFGDIENYFKELFIQDTQYNETQFSKILNMIKNGLNEYNDKTPKLEVKVIIQVCRYSLSQFQNLNKIYDEKHNIKTKLRKYKEKARQLFTDTVKAKTEDVIAARFLCSEIQELIKEKVQKEIPIKIKKETGQHFNFQKHHLIKEILEDLAYKDNFNLYMDYIQNPQKYVEDWLLEFIEKCVFVADKPGQSLYSSWTKVSFSKLIADLVSAARSATQSTMKDCSPAILNWVTCFCALIESKALNFSYNFVQHMTYHCVTDFENFLYCIVEGLREMEEKLNSECEEQAQIQLKYTYVIPNLPLFMSIWGCPEKCPWCHEPCQKSGTDHVHNSEFDRHMCLQHRPLGIGGIVYTRKRKLVIESCNFQIQSTDIISCGLWCGCSNFSKCDKYHLCKEYRKYMPTWDIAPSTDMSSSKYWTWFMVKYKTELAEYYEKELPDIPSSWMSIDKKEAVRSLSEYFG